MTYRVCYVVNAVGGGSIPADIARSVMATSQYEVSLIAWFHASSTPSTSDLRVRSLDAPDSTLGIDRDTLRTARDELAGYDLVHVHHNHSGFYAKMLATLMDTPVISTEHNEHQGFTRNGRVANGLTNRLADRITCVSEAVVQSFSNWERWLLHADRIRVIHNGVELARISNAVNSGTSPIDQPHAFTVASGGKLTRQKGLDTLLRGVAAANRRSGVRIELVLTGEGPLRDELEQLADNLGISESVHFLGFLESRDDVYRVMADAEIYAMPSRWEGFCVAVAEAMAAGTACILSDIPAFRELYDGAASFHAVDDPSELADRIIDLETDIERREELAERGQKRVATRYTAEQVGRAYCDLYDEVLQE